MPTAVVRRAVGSRSHPPGRRGSGTVLLFATIGEIFAERSGVLNLGVEGMMLVGAMPALASASHRQPLAGRSLAMLAAGLLACCTPSSPSISRPIRWSGPGAHVRGHGLAWCSGEGLSKAGAPSLLPRLTIPLLSQIPFAGPDLLRRPERAGLHRLPAGAAGLVLDRPHPARPAPARHRREPDRRRRPGHQRLRLRYVYVHCGRRCWPGWPGHASAWPSHPAGSASRPRRARAGSPSAW